MSSLSTSSINPSKWEQSARDIQTYMLHQRIEPVKDRQAYRLAIRSICDSLQGCSNLPSQVKNAIELLMPDSPEITFDPDDKENQTTRSNAYMPDSALLGLRDALETHRKQLFERAETSPNKNTAKAAGGEVSYANEITVLINHINSQFSIVLGIDGMLLERSEKIPAIDFNMWRPPEMIENWAIAFAERIELVVKNEGIIFFITDNLDLKRINYCIINWQAAQEKNKLIPDLSKRMDAAFNDFREAFIEKFESAQNEGFITYFEYAYLVVNKCKFNCIDCHGNPKKTI